MFMYFHCLSTDFIFSAIVEVIFIFLIFLEMMLRRWHCLFEKYIAVWYVILSWCVLNEKKKNKTTKWNDLSQYNTMVGMKCWCWELLMCACQSPKTCLQIALGKGSRTCLPPWAVLHKALHLYQVYRSSLPHGFFLRNLNRGLKLK